MDGLRRIYARNCEVRRVARSVSGPFLAANHRLGDTSCRYSYGLYHDGELVAVAGFSGPRTWKKGDAVKANNCLGIYKRYHFKPVDFKFQVSDRLENIPEFFGQNLKLLLDK